MTLPIEEKRFDTGEATLNYAETGAGAPLFLLHGGSARWQAFDSILPELAASYHVYAPDLRGHGQSSWTPGRYRLQDYTDDIVRFLRHHLTEQVLLFGHSLGGMIALMTAAQYPGGVRAVAVGDSPLSAASWLGELQKSRDRLMAWRALSGGQRPLAELMEAIKESPVEVPGQAEPLPLRTLMGEDSPVFAWLAANMHQNDPDMLSALLDRYAETAVGYEMASVLPAIRCPTLLMQADPEAGGLMTTSEVEAALNRLAHGHHICLTGVSHVLHNEHKEPVLAALHAFFGPITDG